MRLVTWLLLSAAAWGQNGGLRGFVVDDNGDMLAGALVSLTREYIPDGFTGRTRYSAVTQANGTFEILNVTPGTYAVCGAMQPHMGYVDYCAWTLTPPRIEIRTGVVSDGYRVGLEKGLRVEVAVHDPDSVLGAKSEDSKRDQLRVAVGITGLPPNGMYFSRSGRGSAEYFLYVPKRKGFRVRAEAAEADLSRSGEGAALAKRDASEDVGDLGAAAVKRVEFRYHRKKE